MPGSFSSVFVLAFDLDAKGEPVPVDAPQMAQDEEAGVEQAKALAVRHAGVVVWKREGDPVVGEESEPIVLFQTGRIGDFA